MIEDTSPSQPPDSHIFFSRIGNGNSSSDIAATRRTIAAWAHRNLYTRTSMTEFQQRFPGNIVQAILVVSIRQSVLDHQAFALVTLFHSETPTLAGNGGKPSALTYCVYPNFANELINGLDVPGHQVEADRLGQELERSIVEVVTAIKKGAAWSGDKALQWDRWVLDKLGGVVPDHDVSLNVYGGYGGPF